MGKFHFTSTEGRYFTIHGVNYFTFGNAEYFTKNLPQQVADDIHACGVIGCETYDKPDEEVNPCRIAFFIYKEGSRTLRTPYGDFDLTNVEKLPKRLKNIIEFEED